MSFEILNLNLFQMSIEWFRTLKPISGGMEGRLSPFDGLLRAPYGANKEAQKDKRKYQRMKVAGDKRGSML